VLGRSSSDDAGICQALPFMALGDSLPSPAAAGGGQLLTPRWRSLSLRWHWR